MSTPVRKPTNQSSIPRLRAESGCARADPRRAASTRMPIAPRRRADEEPRDDPRPDDDPPYDIPHRRASSDASPYDEAPYDDEPPYDEVEAEADRRRDEAAYDDFPGDDDATLEDLDEQSAHIRAHSAALLSSIRRGNAPDEQPAARRRLARYVTMLKSIRRDSDAAASPEPRQSRALTAARSTQRRPRHRRPAPATFAPALVHAAAATVRACELFQGHRGRYGRMRRRGGVRLCHGRRLAFTGTLGGREVGADTDPPQRGGHHRPVGRARS